MNKWEKLKEGLADMQEINEDMLKYSQDRDHAEEERIYYNKHKTVKDILFLMEDIEDRELVVKTYKEINTKPQYHIQAGLEYVQGFLKYGHLELTANKEDWDCLSPTEQEDYLIEEGTLVIDGFHLEDWGDITEVNIAEVKNL